MAYVTVTESEGLFTGNDGIVIVSAHDEITGGVVLDTTGWNLDYIPAGHPIIQDQVSGDYKPFPLASGDEALGTLPASHQYVGVLRASILKKKPFGSVVYHGTVNPKAMKFDPSSILSALKSACPHLYFASDVWTS